MEYESIIEDCGTKVTGTDDPYIMDMVSYDIKEGVIDEIIYVYEDGWLSPDWYNCTAHNCSTHLYKLYKINGRLYLAHLYEEYLNSMKALEAKKSKFYDRLLDESSKNFEDFFCIVSKYCNFSVFFIFVRDVK